MRPSHPFRVQRIFLCTLVLWTCSGAHAEPKFGMEESSGGHAQEAPSKHLHERSAQRLTSADAPRQQESERLTLEDALDRAFELNPSYRAAGERLEAVRATSRSRSAPNNPELSVGATWVPEESDEPDEARSQFPDTDETNLRYTFPTSGRRRHRTRGARADVAEAEAQLEVAGRELRSRVMQAYVDLQISQGSVDVQSESSRIARKLVEATQRQHELGLVPETDVTRTRIDTAQAEQEVMRSQGESLTREESLALLIGAPTGQRILAIDPLVSTTSLPELEVLLRIAEENRPEIRAAMASIEAARADVELQRADRRPDVTVQSAFVDHLTNSGNPPMKAWVSLPLWDRGLIGGQVDRARAEVRQREFNLEQTRREVRADVTIAYRQFSSARRVLNLQEKEIVPSARDLLEKARKGYVDGLDTLLSVLDAQRVYRQASLERLKASGEVARSRSQLERAIATDLDAPSSTEGAPRSEVKEDRGGRK